MAHNVWAAGPQSDWMLPWLAGGCEESIHFWALWCRMPSGQLCSFQLRRKLQFRAPHHPQCAPLESHPSPHPPRRLGPLTTSGLCQRTAAPRKGLPGKKGSLNMIQRRRQGLERRHSAARGGPRRVSSMWTRARWGFWNPECVSPSRTLHCLPALSWHAIEAAMHSIDQVALISGCQEQRLYPARSRG